MGQRALEDLSNKKGFTASAIFFQPIYKLKSQNENPFKFRVVLSQTRLENVHLTIISMKKDKCVTNETAINFYKGTQDYYKKSIGDTIEEFMEQSKYRRLKIYLQNSRDYLQ